MRRDILIVGGGIGGAVLAGLLARGGKNVLVLERSSGPTRLVRPEILALPSVKRLAALVPKFTLDEQALVPLQGVLLTHGTEVLLNAAPAIASTGIHPFSTDPARTRELLLQSGNFELQRGVEVISVLKEQHRIIGVRARRLDSGVEEDILAELTVGDDGAHSQVRSACGIGIRVRQFPFDFLCFGFDWPQTFEPAVVRGCINVAELRSGIAALACMPLPAAKGAGLIPVRPRIFEDTSSAQAAFARLLDNNPQFACVVAGRRFPDDFARVRRHWGHAETYSAPGAVLIGDAAHPVSPAGGQGANMAIADAVVLAEALLSGAPGALQAYERRRREANARSLSITRQTALLLSLPEWAGASLLPLGIRYGLSRADVIERGLRFISSAFEDS
ncbi:MAG TPA: FAD-dependent monooxygenase [Planctomycetota bacterium]|nr:FAD-dependent monooxygenase [Planctomycetota bacterium]